MDAEIDIIIPSYNSGEKLIKTLKSVDEQKFDCDVLLTIYVVDDCSDISPKIKTALFNLPIKIIRNKANLGRSGAINVGINASKAGIKLILDDDCTFKSINTLNIGLRLLRSNKVAVLGLVNSYSNKLSSELHARVRSDRGHEIGKLTTACALILDSALESIGGFCEEYECYGFEDRDLIWSLINKFGQQKIGVDSDFEVYHDTSINFKEISEKMKRAGSSSSVVFSRRFPDIYRNLPYYSFDAKYITVARRCLLDILGFFAPLIIKLESVLRTGFVPSGLQVFILRFLTAISFYRGTKQRKHRR